MQTILKILLFCTLIKATTVHINDVKDAHVNVQFTHGNHRHARVNMSGGQSTTDAETPIDPQTGTDPTFSDDDRMPLKVEKTKGTLNYHKMKKGYHKAENEAEIHRLNASLRDADGKQAKIPDHPEYQDSNSHSKILTHEEKMKKHKSIIRELKDGTKSPGPKNVQHIKNRGKLPTGDISISLLDRNCAYNKKKYNYL